MRRTRQKGLSQVQAGVLLILAVVVISYFGFTKAIPFRHHFEIKADLNSAFTLSPSTVVRIAGVNVGKVTNIEYKDADKPGLVRVTMRIDPGGRPIHKDATVALRQRIFLEGNLFVDIHPGTPTAPILKDGGVIPATNTTGTVQLDQILTSLQSNDRQDLVKLLAGLSQGLSGEGGAGYNRSIQYWQSAYKNSAIVNDATLGLAPHDLSRYVTTAGQFSDALDRNPPALKALITDFNTTAGAFAAEQTALEDTLTELPRTLKVASPALASLNRSFPAVRRLTADLRPATRSTGPAIDASLPFITQLRLLVSDTELRGTVADLRDITPHLAELNNELPGLYEQVRLASSCQNEVIIPWSHDKVGDPNFPPTGKVFQEAVKNLPGIAGESRSGDANGQWARVVAGNGAFIYALDLVGDAQQFFGATVFPLEGSNPPKSKEPQYRYDQPCETQQTPNLNTKPGPPLGLVTSRGLLQGRMNTLGQAIALEGVADVLDVEAKKGKKKASGRADEFRKRAAKIRTANNLEGRKFGMKNGKLAIVADGEETDAKKDKKNKKNKDDEGETPPTAPVEQATGVLGTTGAAQP